MNAAVVISSFGALALNNSSRAAMQVLTIEIQTGARRRAWP